MTKIKLLMIAFVAMIHFAFGQTSRRFDGVFSFPLESLASPADLWPCTLGGMSLITQGVFYRKSTCPKACLPDTVFITPYFKEHFSLERKLDSLPTELKRLDFVQDPGPNEDAMYFVPAGRAWRKSAYGLEFFSFQDCRSEFDAEVLGHTTYFMINPKAGRRQKAIRKVDVVLVLVTKFYKLETLNAEG